jgi:hypothetical protein
MVPNTPRIAGPYDGNGSATSFPFSFKVFAKADLQIVRLSALDIESTLTLDSDYTVTLNADQDANPGGTVTYPISGSPLAIGERLTIRGALEIEQQTDFTNQGGFYPQTYEDALDRLTMLVAQVSEENDRAVRAPVSLADVDTALPIPVAGAALVWNEDGTAIVNGVPTESLVALSGYMANVIQAADAVEARSDLGVSLSNLGAADDSAVVKLTGAQTIEGVKTFSDAPVFPVSMFGASLASSGYQRLPSGLIIQWGSVTSSGTGSPNLTATFPLAFPTAILATLLTVSNGTSYVATLTSSSESGFSGVVRSLVAAITSGVVVTYMSVGY